MLGKDSDKEEKKGKKTSQEWEEGYRNFLKETSSLEDIECLFSLMTSKELLKQMLMLQRKIKKKLNMELKQKMSL